jgi:hypothetical protein
LVWLLKLAGSAQPDSAVSWKPQVVKLLRIQVRESRLMGLERLVPGPVLHNSQGRYQISRSWRKIETNLEEEQ